MPKSRTRGKPTTKNNDLIIYFLPKFINYYIMKNLFFALAFMLVGTFAFANTSEVETVNDNVTVENVTLTVTSENGNFMVTFPTTSSMLESTVSDLKLLACTISGSVSYQGASVEFSVTADTCTEAWNGVKHIISDSLGL